MDQTLKWFEDYKFVATIRSSSADDAESMIKAAVAGGLKLFEISMQTPQSIRLIETYSKKENILVGAGTITDGEMAQRAINAGAKFLSSHYTDRDVINVAKNNDSFVIQGAFTPTEAFNAYQYGADLIKIYPAGFAGGVDYIKFLRGPLPFIKLIADGEVTLENAQEYLKYCVAVSLGNPLFDKNLMRSDKWSEVTERAKQFSQKVDAVKFTR
jgi:2-dehydro-3-deoxyphosphogluconate aldolase / (4S)-4-hydroxy-2-oxoglutarate aldolase